MINFSGSKGGGGKALILWSRFTPTGAGGAELLVEVFLGLCSGVHQALPWDVDRGLKLSTLRGSESRVLLAGGLLRSMIIA
jgi:hypothetical protein